MTEEEWLNSNDCSELVRYIRDKASPRKLRLFVIAWCRRNWHLVNKSLFRESVEVAERYADGLASEEELASIHRATGSASWRSHQSSVRVLSIACRASAPDEELFVLASCVASFRKESTRHWQCQILRDL